MNRSENMARIRSRNTLPEIILRRALWAAGFRYRIHAATLAGRPDIVFPGRKVAVYVDGCQWHGCPEHYVHPRSREEFWGNKLRQNVERDRCQTLALESSGWRVVRIWEHEVFEALNRAVDLVAAAVRCKDWIAGPDERVVGVYPVAVDGSIERRHLQALRNPDICTDVVRARSTRKWRRIAREK